MTNRAPYATCEVEKIKECGLSTVDKVERSGYIPNDEKIETFINSGMLLQNMRGNTEEFDVPGTETELDEDSPEYVEELTQDAENFDEPPLMQFMDKITAEETLSEASKTLSEEEEKTKARKNKPKSISDDSRAVIDAINGLSSKLEAKNKAEGEPKV